MHGRIESRCSEPGFSATGIFQSSNIKRRCTNQFLGLTSVSCSMYFILYIHGVTWSNNDQEKPFTNQTRKAKIVGIAVVISKARHSCSCFHLLAKTHKLEILVHLCLTTSLNSRYPILLQYYSTPVEQCVQVVWNANVPGKMERREEALFDGQTNEIPALKQVFTPFSSRIHWKNGNERLTLAKVQWYGHLPIELNNQVVKDEPNGSQIVIHARKEMNSPRLSLYLPFISYWPFW